MAERERQPTTSANAPPPASPRRRRGWRPMLAAVALLALLGRGLGWFGGAPEQPADAPPEEAANEAGGAAPQESRSDAPSGALRGADPGSPRVTPEAHGAPPVAPQPAEVAEPGPPADEPPPPERAAAPPAATLDDDRFDSLLSLVELRLEQGALARAGASLAHLGEQPLSTPQRATVGEFRGRLGAAFDLAAERVAQRLRDGAVLAAEDDLAELFGEGELDAAAASAFARALGGVGITGDWRREVALDDATLPVARPLPRNARVRLRWRECEHVGAVATSSGESVTVRVRTETGQSYPRVARVDCEPVDAAATDAIEMALACLRAGRPLRARLWYACASLRADGGAGEGALDERGRMLGALLR